MEKSPLAVEPTFSISDLAVIYAPSDVLINLRDVSFSNPYQFNRITEIIIQDESHITLARKRYRSYQEAGLKPMMVSV